LRAILSDPNLETYALMARGRRIGLLELDFRRPDECELSFFGVVADAIGKGAGRYLMTQAIMRAFAQPIARFWVHTCTFDSPQALDFYRRSGFRAYKQAVEVMADPRLGARWPRTAAPHVLMLE
jgi:GNAT superfamily N-acetyltransferase